MGESTSNNAPRNALRVKRGRRRSQPANSQPKITQGETSQSPSSDATTRPLRRAKLQVKIVILKQCEMHAI